ncbi:hypothetical protein [Rhizobium sp. NXC24]|uniref:hypothetical protein n=1 Tax=Rhizobium sp. NXC24 TaxID=2048897 RepID=UPI000CDF3D4A|nr:hypothetical protein [Rhizobium sp. NXC24]AVA21977.1 hypothetical protein NXC24_CH02340 [Rhizobium sp. NXC24]
MTNQVQQSQAAQHAEMIGKPLFAILLVVIYGIYRIVQEGVWPAWPNGTILVVGGIVSAVCIIAYMKSIEGGPGRSWGKAVSGFGGLIPYAYSLFGVLIGYRILKSFYDITEVVAASQ